jgi:hypothetical protein
MTTENPTEPGQRACAVCARILNSWTDADTGEVIYDHTPQDGAVDHPAMPVEPAAIHTEYRCDFCNEDESAFILPVRDFLLPGTANAHSGTDWSACNPCAALIDLNQWSALKRRCEAVWRFRHGVDMDATRKQGLTILWRAMRKNISGSLRPFINPNDMSPRLPEGTEGSSSVLDGQTRARTAFSVDREGRQVPDTE